MSKLGDPDWKAPLEKPYITEERMTARAPDPLSDEAFVEYDQSPYVDKLRLAHADDGVDLCYLYWQEARRRATEKRDADLESLHVYYRADNQRLRELLRDCRNGRDHGMTHRQADKLYERVRAALGDK